MPQPRTQVVVLTPPGRGAVASILVSGAGGTEAVAKLFHPAQGRPLQEQPLGKIVFGHWGSKDGEELVVSRLGPERIEIHCHGGAVAPEAIVEALMNQGCARTDWQDWLAASDPDPISAQARLTLAEARTERTAAILLDQYAGALRRSFVELAQLLEANNSPAALLLVRQLLSRAPLGLHLVQPWKIVLAGRPNVGKSSLINALLGYQRSIVFDTPGTTRDVVTATTALDGWPVELADTAGLHASDDPLEMAGVNLARQRLQAADVVVLVFDASHPWQPSDCEILDAWPAALMVHNKSDMGIADLARPAGLLTSAVTQQGVNMLASTLAARLVPTPPPPGIAVPFTPIQIQALGEVAAALERGEPASSVAGFVTDIRIDSR